MALESETLSVFMRVQTALDQLSLTLIELMFWRFSPAQAPVELSWLSHCLVIDCCLSPTESIAQERHEEREQAREGAGRNGHRLV